MSNPRPTQVASSPLSVTSAFVAILLAFAQTYQCAISHQKPTPGLLISPPLLSIVFTTPANRLPSIPIARMNLLCATGLDQNIDLAQNESTLRDWAQHIKSETARHFYRFRAHPEQFENSEGFYSMLMMSVVLAEDFKVHYADEKKFEPGSTLASPASLPHDEPRIRKSAAENSPSPRLAASERRAETGGEGRGEGGLFLSPGDSFFSGPDYIFLTGLLGPERKGTCSSMPVLYVAIGRELGYPLKLVTTKGHLFVRWESPSERFNIEATTRGLSRFDDDYYRHWPFEITSAEEQAEGYLKSLTPQEELAVFISIRGMCLRQAKRHSEAAEAFATAANLAPNCASYQNLANLTKNQIVSKNQPQSSKGQKL